METSFMGVFLNSVPMLLLIGVWIFFMRRLGGSQKSMTKFQSEYIEEMRRQTQIQERIALALEKNGTNG